MSKKLTIGLSSLLIVLLVLDQGLKFWVKISMKIGEEITVFNDWFYLYFLENSGAAFGLQLDFPWFKPCLSIFRIVIIGLIVWYFFKLLRKNTPTGILVCFTLILAGAIGNIIDSMFYGMIFSESNHYQTAQFVSADGGYAPFLYGKVVDMLYFPLIEITLPDWIPVRGGTQFTFFRPVFNMADSYITISIFTLLFFFRGWFTKQKAARPLNLKKID